MWQCAFQPDCNDRRKTTSIVATCGGNSVCFIDVEKGIVPYKYYAKDSRYVHCILISNLQIYGNKLFECINMKVKM